MELLSTTLPGVLLIKPRVFEDPRGFFLESYSARTMQGQGVSTVFVQDNHSRSVRNTLRGMHYQINGGQVKLVRVVQGTIFDVVIDLRRDAPTFGQWFGAELSAENFLQMYIPVGFAHGFCVLSDTAEVLYKCSSYYSPADERGLMWNDPEIGITWPITAPILSERDQAHPPLAEAATFDGG